MQLLSPDRSADTALCSAEFKELRKQWRLQKKEQEEVNRERARYEQLQLEREQEDRRNLEYMPVPLQGVAQQLPSGLPMPAHSMRSELINVGIPMDSSLIPSNLPAGMGLSGSMALSPGSLAAFPPSTMGMPAGHGLVGPGQNFPAFNRARTTGSFDFHMQHSQQSLHPQAHAAQMDGARHHHHHAHHHRGSVDAEAHGRFDYEQRRASFDHVRAYDKAAYDQGHRVGGAYGEMQQPAGMIYRRRGSQPYPSPHSLTHSPHAQAPTSPRSMYPGHTTGGLSYPEEEYGEAYDYRERQQQQPHSPVEERFPEGEYYLDRAQQQPRWEQLPPLAPHQTQPHSLSLATQPHALGSGLVQETTPSSTDTGAVESDAAVDSGEPQFASHVSLGSNRLPPNSTLLTPLSNFRGYEQQDEQWEPEEDERDERSAV